MFLTRLFRKVKFGSGNKLLAISEDNKNYREIGNQGSDTSLLFDAERMFQDIFLEEILPMENNSNYICTNSVFSLFYSVS